MGAVANLHPTNRTNPSKILPNLIGLHSGNQLDSDDCVPADRDELLRDKGSGSGLGARIKGSGFTC